MTHAYLLNNPDAVMLSGCFDMKTVSETLNGNDRLKTIFNYRPGETLSRATAKQYLDEYIRIMGFDPTETVPEPVVRWVLFGSNYNPASIGNVNNNSGKPVTWGLPGQGEVAPGDGWVTHTMNCKHHGEVHRRTQTCKKFSCPHCWVDAIKRAVHESERGLADKLLTGWEFYQDRNNRNGLRGAMLHVVISPPRKEWDKARTLEGWKALRKESMNMMMASGMDGGIAIFHPFRQNGDKDSIDPVDNKNSQEGRWGPHFHMVGYGYVSVYAEALETARRMGWVIKVKTIPKPTEVGRICTYLLSHVGVIYSDLGKKKPKMIQSFGSLSSVARTALKIADGWGYDEPIVVKAVSTARCDVEDKWGHRCGCVLDCIRHGYGNGEYTDEVIGEYEERREYHIFVPNDPDIIRQARTIVKQYSAIGLGALIHFVDSCHYMWMKIDYDTYMDMDGPWTFTIENMSPSRGRR